MHLNLPFREPLLGTAGELPPALATAEARVDRRIDVSGLAELDGQRGVIVAGGRSGVSPEAIEALAAATGWPVLADPTSGATHLDTAVTYGDALLRHVRFADDHRPELIVRLGRPPASRDRQRVARGIGRTGRTGRWARCHRPRPPCGGLVAAERRRRPLRCLVRRHGHAVGGPLAPRQARPGSQ